MWSCSGNMPKYYPGLRDILPDPNFGILPGQDHINIIIILSVIVQVICQNITVPNITTESYTKYNNGDYYSSCKKRSL